MTAQDLPPRPGEPRPGDVGKKGGKPEHPVIDEPTDLPPDKKEGPIRQPTV